MKQNMYIHVRVSTKGRSESIEKKKYTYYITVKEKPERGAANKRVREILAQTFHGNPKEFRLVKGGTSPSKTYLFTNHSHHEN